MDDPVFTASNALPLLGDGRRRTCKREERISKSYPGEHAVLQGALFKA